MEAIRNASSRKGLRYTIAQKKEILQWIEDYNAEHGRGGGGAAARHFDVSAASISNWRNKEAIKRAAEGVRAAELTSRISEQQFMRVLAGRGFRCSKLVDGYTGEVVEEKKDPRIEKLNLKFAPMPQTDADHAAIYVTQTSPSIQVTMTLDRLLEIAGIKP